MSEPSINACRHFRGLIPSNRPSCAKGRDVRAWAERCNGGSSLGIFLRLPCTKQKGDTKPLFDCPGVDRKTDEEVEAARKEMTAHIDRVVSAMPELAKMNRKMIDNNLSKAKATCPWCGGKNTLNVSCAIGSNNHMRAHCAACDMGLME